MSDAREIAAKLPKPARNRLRRYACGWCGQSLHMGSCAAIYERCTDAIRLTRMADCLDASKVAEIRAVAAALRGAETDA